MLPFIPHVSSSPACYSTVVRCNPKRHYTFQRLIHDELNLESCLCSSQVAPMRLQQFWNWPVHAAVGGVLRRSLIAWRSFETRSLRIAGYWWVPSNEDIFVFLSQDLPNLEIDMHDQAITQVHVQISEALWLRELGRGNLGRFGAGKQRCFNRPSG